MIFNPPPTDDFWQLHEEIGKDNAAITRQLRGVMIDKKDPYYDRNNALCSKDWLKHLVRISINKHAKVQYHALKKLDFYQNWLLIMKNDLARKKPSGFLTGCGISIHDAFIPISDQKDFEEIRNHNLIFKIDWALIKFLGYIRFFMLLSGMIAIDEDNNFIPLRHDFKTQSNLLSEFDIRPLHDDSITKIDDDYLEGYISIEGMRVPKILVVSNSFFTFGYYHQFRTLNPPKKLAIKLTRQNSVFLKDYFNVFNPQNARDYMEALHLYLKDTFKRFPPPF